MIVLLSSDGSGSGLDSSLGSSLGLLSFGLFVSLDCAVDEGDPAASLVAPSPTPLESENAS